MQFSVQAFDPAGRPETRNDARPEQSTGLMLTAMTRRRSRAAPLAAAIAALLASGSALALSLGPIEVGSALGEPLRAELALGIAPGERIVPECFRLSTDASAGARAGLPYEASLRILGSGPAQRLAITGRTPLREPLVDLVVAVECAGAPRLQRGYTLLLSPGGLAAPARPAAAATAVTPPQTAADSTAAATRSGAAPRPARTPARPPTRRPDTPLAAGEPYRVRPGDTLSTIAERVRDRDLSIWAQAEAIFSANPDAFINGDPNRLRAGSLLVIPPAAGSGATPATTMSSRPRETLTAVVPRIGERPEIITTAGVTSTSPVAAIAGAATTAPRQPAQPMGPPRPERLVATTPRPATPPPAAAAMTPSAETTGRLRGWLAGLLVGLGFISLGALLGWTALRRRPVDGAHADLETTIQAGRPPQGVRLTPPPSFDRGLQPTGSYTVEITPPDDNLAAARAGGLVDDTPTDEVTVLGEATGTADGDDALDDLLSAAAPDDTDRAAVQGADPRSAPVNPRAGDTTIEHRFEGFSDTQALDVQMAEAMAMLEQDYTSRFEAAVSLDDSGEQDATDTLHALPGDVTQSLEDLRRQAGEDAAADAGLADDEPADTQERTALMETPPGRVGTG